MSNDTTAPQATPDPAIQDPSATGFPPGKIKHFIKELIHQNQVRLMLTRPDGKELFVVPWEDLGDEVGAYSTDDVQVIMALRSLQKRRLQGVREVTAEELERTKKASSANEQRRASLKANSPLLKGIRMDRPGEPVAAGAPVKSRFADPIQTQEFVETGKKVELPSIEDRTPRGRKASKATKATT